MRSHVLGGKKICKTDMYTGFPSEKEAFVIPDVLSVLRGLFSANSAVKSFFRTHAG
jgi:hypothetical protein